MMGLERSERETKLFKINPFQENNSWARNQNRQPIEKYFLLSSYDMIL